MKFKFSAVLSIVICTLSSSVSANFFPNFLSHTFNDQPPKEPTIIPVDTAPTALEFYLDFNCDILHLEKIRNKREINSVKRQWLTLTKQYIKAENKHDYEKAQQLSNELEIQKRLFEKYQLNDMTLNTALKQKKCD